MYQSCFHSLQPQAYEKLRWQLEAIFNVFTYRVLFLVAPASFPDACATTYKQYT